MIETRNNTSHTYEKIVAENTVTSIVEEYYSEFVKLKDEFLKILNE